MPGCKLEVWDHGSGLEVILHHSLWSEFSIIFYHHPSFSFFDLCFSLFSIFAVFFVLIFPSFSIIIILNVKDAIDEERKGFNQGDYKNMKDLWVKLYILSHLFINLDSNCKINECGRNYSSLVPRYDQNKLIFRADRTKPHWVQFSFFISLFSCLCLMIEKCHQFFQNILKSWLLNHDS